MMRILPVLDLMAGQVVRGIAGRRELYSPIRSLLTASSEPLDVASAMRRQYGLAELYVADLDAIAGAQPNITTYEALQNEGFTLWVDAGIHLPDDAEKLSSVARIVAGLETVAGPAVLAELCRRHGERLVFSLDLRDGQPLGAWEERAPRAIAAVSIALGVRRIIVLDLHRVGRNTGTGTEGLCAELASDYPSVEILAGGGIADRETLNRLRSLGVRGALVASALHDGRLGRDDLLSIQEPSRSD